MNGQAAQPNRWLRSLVTIGFTVFLVSAGATAAHAATVKSSIKNIGTTGAYTFNTYSMVNDIGGGGTWGVTYASALKTAPTGWMGAQARLYEADGVLCKSSSSVYNPSPINTFAAETFGNCGVGYHYGFGRGARWNGSGYTWSNNYTTPHILLP